MTAVPALVERYRAADAYRLTHALSEWDDGWCRCSASGQVLISRLDVAELARLAALGCRVDVDLEVDRFRLRVSAENSPRFIIETEGEWADAAIDDESARAGPQAAVSQNLELVVSLLRDVHTVARLTVLDRTDEYSWVRSAGAMVREYDRAGWWNFASLIAAAAPDIRRVVVLDAEDGWLRSPGLVVHGPDAWPKPEPWIDPGAEFAVTGPRSLKDVPSPGALFPTQTLGSNMAAVDEVVRGVAGALAWLWLADTVRTDRDVSIRFEGSRPISGSLPASPPDAAAASVSLWRWVVSGNQAGRRHAAIQALTLQIDAPADLFRRAGSILDTAEFLFSVAQSGLVQEALSARRAAKDAAVAAGREAADRARSSARSAVDRTLVVIGASVGIVLANKGDLIERPIALALLGLAMTLVIGAGVLAFHLELPAAGRTIDVFLSELELGGDVLLPRDVDAVRRLPSLAEGRSQVERARWATGAILVAAVVALGSLGVVLGTSSGEVSNEPSSTTTTAPTSSSAGRTTSTSATPTTSRSTAITAVP